MKLHQNHKMMSGFTFVELLITVLIMGIIAAVAVPKISGSIVAYRTELAANQIKNNLKLASLRARGKGVPVKINFETQNATHNGFYWFDNVVDPQRPNELLSVEIGKPNYPIQLDQAPSEITFDVYGYADVDATWILNSTLPSEKTITIEKASGRILVQ